MNDLLSTELSNRFGTSILKGSMISNGIYLSEPMLIIRPQTLLEIGTLLGCSAAFFSQYAKTVITLDLNSAAPTNQKIAEEVWVYLGIKHRVTNILVADNCEKRQFISTQRFDMAFIDGGHTYHDVEYDFDCVKNCGIVLFHDYKPANPQYTDCDNKRYEGIVRFVDSLLPPAYIWGPHCSKFALWIEPSHPLRVKAPFIEWLNLHSK